MRKNLTLLLTLVALLATFSACQSDNAEPAPETSQPEVAAESVKTDNPLAPENTQDWSDEDWENWVEDGYNIEEWDEDVFQQNSDDPSTEDIWDEDDWKDAQWEDETLELTTVSFSSNTANTDLSSLLIHTSSSSDEAGVRAIFNAFNPGADILAVRLQNDSKIYAIFGLKDSTKYKMLVDATTNEVYLNKAISTGAPANSENNAKVNVPMADGSLPEDSAKMIFLSYHPDATILKSQLQDGGNNFYIYGEDSANRYQMKIQESNGAVLFHRSNHIGTGYSDIMHSPSLSTKEILDANESSINEPESTDVPESSDIPVTSGGPITEANAREMFQSFYPNANILQVKLQDGGKSYYLFGQDGNSRYKMKILTHNGEVVMNRSSHAGGGNYAPPVNDDTPVISDTPTTELPSGGSVDATGANSIFNSYYPGVPISTTELQDDGKAYYMYGESDGIHYKMKVLVHDGSVVYTNAGGNGYNNSAQTDATAGATVDSYSGATNRRGRKY